MSPFQPNVRRAAWWFSVLLAVAAGCAAREGDSIGTSEAAPAAVDDHSMYVLTAADTAELERAIFAGGCFWCEETAYEGVKGVHAVISGFVGGAESNPTYEQVSSGETGHTEAVLVTFDPKVITYSRLLEIFWVNHDPTTGDQQFCDRGPQYRAGVFYLTDAQKRHAEASRKWALTQRRFKEPILTEISPATPFWPAEIYHQDFYKKNPVRYQTYRLGCGRDARLAQLWGTGAAKH